MREVIAQIDCSKNLFDFHFPIYLSISMFAKLSTYQTFSSRRAWRETFLVVNCLLTYKNKYMNKLTRLRVLVLVYLCLFRQTRSAVLWCNFTLRCLHNSNQNVFLCLFSFLTFSRKHFSVRFTLYNFRPTATLCHDGSVGPGNKCRPLWILQTKNDLL